MVMKLHGAQCNGVVDVWYFSWTMTFLGNNDINPEFQQVKWVLMYFSFDLLSCQNVPAFEMIFSDLYSRHNAKARHITLTSM